MGNYLGNGILDLCADVNAAPLLYAHRRAYKRGAAFTPPQDRYVLCSYLLDHLITTYFECDKLVTHLPPNPITKARQQTAPPRCLLVAVG